MDHKPSRFSYAVFFSFMIALMFVTLGLYNGCKTVEVETTLTLAELAAETRDEVVRVDINGGVPARGQPGVKTVNVKGRAVNQFDQLPEAVRAREVPK